MKLDEVARLVVASRERSERSESHESNESQESRDSRVIVAEWRGRRLVGSAHVHVDRLKYRGMMVPRCAKRAVLFLAARIVEKARETGTAVVAGHGDGGIVAALAAECARTELAFDAATTSRRVVRSVSFGAPMRYPVRADVRVVMTSDTRALYPCGARSGRFVFLGPTDTAFYARMAMAAIGGAFGAAVGGAASPASPASPASRSSASSASSASSTQTATMEHYARACADSGYSGYSGDSGYSDYSGSCTHEDNGRDGHNGQNSSRGDEAGLEWVVVGE